MLRKPAFSVSPEELLLRFNGAGAECSGNQINDGTTPLDPLLLQWGRSGMLRKPLEFKII